MRSKLDTSCSRCLAPLEVSLYTRTRRFVAETFHSAVTSSSFNNSCSAGYNDPSSICNRWSEACLMYWQSAYPCSGWRRRVRRIIISRAPGNRSRGLLVFICSDRYRCRTQIQNKYCFSLYLEQNGVQGIHILPQAGNQNLLIRSQSDQRAAPERTFPRLPGPAEAGVE